MQLKLKLNLEKLYLYGYSSKRLKKAPNRLLHCSTLYLDTVNKRQNYTNDKSIKFWRKPMKINEKIQMRDKSKIYNEIDINPCSTPTIQAGSEVDEHRKHEISERTSC